MRSIHDVPAPAKLNLFLHVVGRRADGYHLLQSVFMLIDWCDTLHFERRRDGRITREDLGAPLPEDDLAVRAAHALQAATACTAGVHLAVQKRIPLQAGLGGGSSDAASTLLALNRLWGLHLSRQQLMAVARPLGADVPLFLCGHHAWIEGIGEPVQRVPLPPARFLVVKPAAGVDTAEIFQSGLLKPHIVPATIAGFRAAPYEFGRNDLQPIAEQLCPPVSAALKWLSRQGHDGRMTGSGSAVFAHVAQESAASPDTLPPDWLMRRCSNLSAHPLCGWADDDRSSESHV